MNSINTINTSTLCAWLSHKKPVSILDVRPNSERAEWYIPGSIHYPAYEKLTLNDNLVFEHLHLEKSIPVVTFCAGGKMSRVAAALLQQKGYTVYSLEGGLKAWSLAWNTAVVNFEKFSVMQFRRTGKGCLSYMVISGNEAMVLDASLEIEAYQQIIDKEKLSLKFVIETHIHADHLSRSKELAEVYNAKLYLPSPNTVTFKHDAIANNEILSLGGIAIKTIKTPGHTIESTCYIADESVLFTGDTLFLNGVGRPDLKATNEEAAVKSAQLYHSLQVIFNLSEHLLVLPGHTNKPVDFDNKVLFTTVGACKEKFLALSLTETTFIENLQKIIPSTPPNYQLISEINLTGDFTLIHATELEAGANRCAVQL